MKNMCKLREQRLNLKPSNLYSDKQARIIYSEIELLKMDDNIPVDYKYMIHGIPGRDHTVNILRADKTLVGSFKVEEELSSITHSTTLKIYLYDSIMHEFTSTTHTASAPA